MIERIKNITQAEFLTERTMHVGSFQLLQVVNGPRQVFGIELCESRGFAGGPHAAGGSVYCQIDKDLLVQLANAILREFS